MKSRRGSVLVVSVLLSMLFAMLGFGFLRSSIVEGKLSTEEKQRTQSFYHSEAGLESGLRDLKVLLVGNSTLPSVADLNSIRDNHLSGFAHRALPAPYRFNDFRVDLVSPERQEVLGEGSPFAGLNSLSVEYQVTSEVEGPDGGRSRVTQVLSLARIPLFQFGVFYGKGVDFKHTPGPEMTLSGRIHVNDDIYTTADC
jgi:hypothetical protein